MSTSIAPAPAFIPAPAQPASAAPTYSDIIIAVHGIGAQQRNATVRSVATRLAGSPILLGNSPRRPVATQPLGYFDADVHALAAVCRLDEDSRLNEKLATIGFTEVFWADVPQDVVAEGRTLEETKAWARTVVARARAQCESAADRDSIIPPDFGLAAEVIEEIIETIHVLENLTKIADKAGLFTFELRKILDEYVGDVQLVTEFGSHRKKILGRFQERLATIHRKYCTGDKPARLHVVAHSEGTVVSFLGLLHAMSGQVFSAGDGSPRDAKEAAWVGHVHGFMTIGSPIDKHLLLWPQLWRTLAPQGGSARPKPKQIRWRNYYDYGDPVGFKLDTARRWLALKKTDTFFEFEQHHDHGFARYVLPGKAHNDYWHDSDVFEHFIRSVVLRPAGATDPGDHAPAPPRTRGFVAIVSPAFPYVLSVVIVMAAVYILYKVVADFAHPELDPLHDYMLQQQIGVTRTNATSGAMLLRYVLGISGLVVGTTLLARIPRLAGGTPLLRKAVRAVAGHERVKALGETLGDKLHPLLAARPQISSAAHGLAQQARRTMRWFWRFVGAGAFALGAIGYVKLVDAPVRAEIGGIFPRLGFDHPTLGVLLFAALVGLGGLAVTLRAGADADTRDRWSLQLARFIGAAFWAGLGLWIFGKIFPHWWQRIPWPHFDSSQLSWQSIALAAGALMAALVVLLLARRDDHDRRDRWLFKGMRPLILLGGLAVALLVVDKLLPRELPLTPEERALLNEAEHNILKEARFDRRELTQFFARENPVPFAERRAHLAQVQPLLANPAKTWPVVLATAAFLYLWWLATLIFDLAFVWQRYVRQAVHLEEMKRWAPDDLWDPPKR